MNFDRGTSIIGGLTMIALATTLVAHRQTARIATALGNSGAKLYRAAMGR
jgi:hypothetical protein